MHLIKQAVLVLLALSLPYSLALAEEAVVPVVEDAVDVAIESSEPCAGASERQTHDVAMDLSFEPDWMVGEAAIEQPFPELYPGYCYNDCSSCYPVGPRNPSCTSPEFPGVYFSCTAERLC